MKRKIPSLGVLFFILPLLSEKIKYLIASGIWAGGGCVALSFASQAGRTPLQLGVLQCARPASWKRALQTLQFHNAPRMYHVPATVGRAGRLFGRHGWTTCPFSIRSCRASAPRAIVPPQARQWRPPEPRRWAVGR